MRHLERLWKRSGDETDRRSYRTACREANRLITKSRQDHYRDRLSTCDSKSRWRIIRELLHSTNSSGDQSDVDNDVLCTSFLTFFNDKIALLKQSIVSTLNSLAHSVTFFDDPLHSGTTLFGLPPVSCDEVL